MSFLTYLTWILGFLTGWDKEVRSAQKSHLRRQLNHCAATSDESLLGSSELLWTSFSFSWWRPSLRSPAASSCLACLSRSSRSFCSYLRSGVPR